MRSLCLLGATVLGIATLAACAPGAQSPPSGQVEQRASAPGTWTLLRAAEVSSESTTLQLGVVRLDCSGGVTGETLMPEVHFEEDRILIRANVAPLPEGAHTCPDNDSVPVMVKLAEPIDGRELMDAACLDDQVAETTFCSDGGIRWRP